MCMILNMYIASFYVVFLSNITKVKCFLSTKGIYIQIKSNYRCFIKNKANGSSVNRHLLHSNKMQTGQPRSLWFWWCFFERKKKQIISFMYRIYLPTGNYLSSILSGRERRLFSGEKGDWPHIQSISRK